MSKELFAHVSSLLHKKMLDDGFKGIMEYRPFSDDYWNTKPKIVICNYENFGYQDCEKPSLLTYEDFKWWFDERLNKAKKRGKSKTVHYSVVFANALQKLINKSENESLLTYEAFRKSYWKYDELYKSMKSIMYMNLRPTSASGNKQEIGETHKIIKKYRIEMKSFILALDADIFILSTKDSVNKRRCQYLLPFSVPVFSSGIIPEEYLCLWILCSRFAQGDHRTFTTPAIWRSIAVPEGVVVAESFIVQCNVILPAILDIQKW